MADNRNSLPFSEKPPLYQLIAVLLIIILAVVAIFPGLVFAGSLISGVDTGILDDLTSATGEKSEAFLRYILICQDITVFILPAMIILLILKPEGETGIRDLYRPNGEMVIMVIIMTFFVFPVTSFTGELNSHLKLPAFLSGAENWMLDKENDIDTLIDMIIGPGNFRSFLLNIFVMALLPAVGEELIFRGVIQKLLSRLFRSGNAAVWLTAFLFSSLHLQFFGFLPRFILGLIFGYLFLWGRNLWLPVIAHFINNAVSLTGIESDIPVRVVSSAENPFWRNMIIIVIAGSIILVILFYIKNLAIEQKKISDNL
jgi:uncharacterized protein